MTTKIEPWKAAVTAQLETEYAADNIACMDCGKPAAMIGTGHRDEPCPNIQPPPPWFKCATCHLNWYRNMVQALNQAVHLECANCGGWFETINEFSAWRPA